MLFYQEPKIQIEYTDADIISFIRLSRTKGVGISYLIDKINEGMSPENLINHLQNVPRSKDIDIPPTEDAENILSIARKHDSFAIPINHTSYPALLRSISNPPLVLYAKGNIQLLKKDIVAIVGSRNPLPESKQVAFEFAKNLSENNITIASGFARGVDTESCLGSLTKGTIQVLAGGLDLIYPKQNTKLFYEVLANNGLFISEHPFGSLHSYKRKTQDGKIIPASNFPMRNRIISGISRAVLIVQASRKNITTKTGNSGTLNTAFTALSQGKILLAIAGHPFEERMSGCNELIKNGQATSVTSYNDILARLGFKTQSALEEIQRVNHAKQNLNPLQTKIIKSISLNPVFIEELADFINEPLPSVALEIAQLEIEGIVEREISGKIRKRIG